MAENQCKETCESGQGWSLTTWDFCRSDFDSIHLPGGAVQKHHSWYLLASNTCLSLTEKNNTGHTHACLCRGRQEMSFPAPVMLCMFQKKGRKKTERVELVYDHPSLIVL